MKTKCEIKEDQCPICNSEALHYEDIEWHGTQIGQNCRCDECDFVFMQWYITTFDGMTYENDKGENEPLNY